jgi:enoyl-CoA hydratase/carnithine racemase
MKNLYFRMLLSKPVIAAVEEYAVAGGLEVNINYNFNNK